MGSPLTPIAPLPTRRRRVSVEPTGLPTRRAAERRPARRPVSSAWWSATAQPERQSCIFRWCGDDRIDLLFNAKGAEVKQISAPLLAGDCRCMLGANLTIIGYLLQECAPYRFVGQLGRARVQQLVGP